MREGSFSSKGRSHGAESKGFDYTSGRCIDARSRSPFLDLLKRPSRSPFNSLPAVQVISQCIRGGRIGRPWPPISPHGDVSSSSLEPRGRGARFASVTREPLPGLTWKTSRYKALPGPWTSVRRGRPREAEDAPQVVPRYLEIRFDFLTSARNKLEYATRFRPACTLVQR